jgi:Fe2+ transport system protein FeoA
MRDYVWIVCKPNNYKQLRSTISKSPSAKSIKNEMSTCRKKVIAIGILPGMPITLLRRSPSYLFEVDQTRYAVYREIANHIMLAIDFAASDEKSRKKL